MTRDTEPTCHSLTVRIAMAMLLSVNLPPASPNNVHAIQLASFTQLSTSVYNSTPLVLGVEHTASDTQPSPSTVFKGSHVPSQSWSHLPSSHQPSDQEQTTRHTETRQGHTTLHTSTQTSFRGPTTLQMTATQDPTQSQPPVSITTDDVLNCLTGNSSSLQYTAEEVWLSLSYRGNLSGSPRLHAPSTCRLNVQGNRIKYMSLLIFNMTCSKDNRLVVHSKMNYRLSYDCDPLAWLAPGLELCMNTFLASVSIEIKDVHAPFRLHAQFKTLPMRWKYRLEIRNVTHFLGTSV